MIIPAYKPLGVSTHCFAQQIGEQYGEKASHTGSLDPLAEGIVIVLTGTDRFRKEELSNWKKEYVFEILGGVRTDSHDLLGIVKTQTEIRIPVRDLAHQIQQIIPEFIGKQTQLIPRFAARRIDGESYFAKARRQEDFPQATQLIEIFDLILLEEYSITGLDLLESIQSKLALVNGDFRQEEIIERWKDTCRSINDDSILKLPIVKLKATTSRRTYIRGLVRDVSNTLQVPSVVYSITRTRNGEFGVEDCRSTQSLN